VDFNNIRMKTVHRFSAASQLAILFALVSSSLLFAGDGSITAPGLARPLPQVLHNHVRPAVSSGKAVLVGSLPATQELNVSIVLPLRNQAGLTALLSGLYDPSSPGYRRYLSVEQFTEQFGPTTQDYQAVVDFAQSNGLTVTATPANRLLVPVTGTVAQIEKAFNVSMKVYRHPTERRTFFSPDREPSLNLVVPVAHIAGLNNFSIPRPMLTKAPAGQTSAVTGSGPGGWYLGSDMRAAYYGGTALTGSGQAVGLVEFDGYKLSDVNLTFSNAGQSYSVPINNVLLDGATGAPVYGDDGEQVLDIVQAIGMAPGLSQVRVYIGNNDADILNAMATENIAQQLSISWTWNPDDPSTDEIFFQEFAAQGQTLFAASGDGGGFDPLEDNFYPAEDAYATAVGGTDLVTNGAGGSWSSETAWDFSGGGISPDSIPIPSWQANVANAANGGSTTLRNVPDVAMEADTDNYHCDMGACAAAGGTSFAAPRWAGFVALVNQQAAANGNPTVGFISPAIYAIGESSSYNNDFNDITVGSNDVGDIGVVTYNAAPGYDLVTGLGSPAGQNLINALAPPAGAGFQLSASPTSLTINPGSAGATTITVTDQGGFSGSVNLAVSGLPASVTAAWGTNPTSGSSVLTLTVDSSAIRGSYLVTITGTSGAQTATTNVALAVNAPGFSIAPSPASLMIAPSTSIQTTLTATNYAGFTGAVTYAVTSALPTGITALWNTGTTDGTSVLMLTASGSAVPDTRVMVTITGTSGALTATTTIALTVKGPDYILDVSPMPFYIVQGSSVTATVTMVPVGDFTETATLSTASLPTGVTATYNPVTISPGGTSVLTLTASSSAPVAYSGVEIFSSTSCCTGSNSFPVVIIAAPTPAFTLGKSAAYLTITQGGSVTDTVTVNPQGGFNGSVTLGIPSLYLPSGITASFSPNPTTGTSVLTLSAGNSAAVGSGDLLSIQGSGATQVGTPLSALTAVYLQVNPRPGFALGASPASLTVTQGASGSSTVTVTNQPGFTGSVSLAANGLPNGVTAQFGTNPTTGTSLVTLSASNSATPGSYSVIITGTSGTQTATATLPLAINQAQSSTTTTLSSSPNPSTFGQSVTFVAAVSPVSATGTAQFLDGGTPIGAATLTGGTAALAVSTLAVGTHSITAVYSGDPSDLGSTSAAVVQTVNQAASSVTLTSSVNPATAWETIIFTATVSPASATGTVQLVYNGTTMATVTISGGSAVTSAAMAPGTYSITAVYSGDANDAPSTSATLVETINKASTTIVMTSSTNQISLGQVFGLSATITPSTATGIVQLMDNGALLGTGTVVGGLSTFSVMLPTAGTHSITAVYTGDANDTASTSAPVVITVTKGSSTVAVTSSTNPSTAGQSVIFTATISPINATGTVQFLDGATTLGTATVGSGSGLALLVAAIPTAGAHSITAVYSGDGNYTASTSAVLKQTVNKAASSVALASSLNPSTFGQSVTFTAAVSPSTATGTVKFLDGSTALGTVTISGGSAALSLSTLSAGAHSITAAYSGDANDNSSTSNTVAETVQKATTTAAIISYGTRAPLGQSVQFTVAVTPVAASGTVNLMTGTKVLATSTLSNGTATFNVSGLPAGSTSIYAQYAGNASYSSSTSATVTEVVLLLTSTVLTTSPNPSAYGAAVTLTLTVTPSAATGPVEFVNGATTIGTANLVNGQAKFTVTNLPVGSNSLTADYSGDAVHAGFTSLPVTQTVNKASTTVTLNSSKNPAASGQSVTFTAAVSPSSATGTIQFLDGSTVLGTVTIGGGSAALSTSSLSVDAHSIKATYSGDANYLTNSSAVLTQNITGAACHVTYSVTSQWNDGFGTAITIKNTGTTAVNGWNLTWSWAGNQKITESWDATFSQSGANAKLTNESYNAAIAAGATITGIGFNASYSGTNTAPSAFYLNGTLCK